MGPPDGGVHERTFSLFSSLGAPLETHRAPRGPPEGPRKPPRGNLEPFLLQFSHMFDPFWLHFSEHFGFGFHMFFHSFLSTVAQQPTQQKGILSVTGQQPTQQKGILSVRQQADNLHSKRATQHSRRPTTNVPCTPLRHAAQACWQLHCTQHATTMPALLTEIRAQSSNHKVTKQGTVAGLPQGNWIVVQLPCKAFAPECVSTGRRSAKNQMDILPQP